MIFKESTCTGIVIVVVFCCFSFNSLAADLTWQTTKQAAINLATEQDKKIILLAGRDT